MEQGEWLSFSFKKVCKELRLKGSNHKNSNG